MTRVVGRSILSGLVLSFLCHCSSIMPGTRAGITAELPGRTHWTANDGKRLPYTRWPAGEASLPRQPRDIYICVHGLSGAASDFWALGEHFQERGAVVYAMEVRGQGNDPNKATHGDIRSAELWIQDLYAFTRMARKRHPLARVFWYGESMGALISIHALADAAEKAPDVLPIAGLVLASPVTSIRHKVPRWKKTIIHTLMKAAPGCRISLERLGSREVREQNVTSTTTHRGQMENTPHYVETFTFRLFRELEELIDTSHEAAAGIKDPVLIFYTPNDVFTSKEGVESFFSDLGTSDKKKVFFPGSYHLILNDKDRPRVLLELEDWTLIKP
jgi:acylglycerol lipase